ncbi:MAG: SIS domain-containing protein [Proteobacteria bacterium]|nr:SIS domain-containing protein [Pseudomonadota bacterium]MBU2261539.1 SIS domain-containing protein [Pseudomonadota bacterium]
MTERIARLIRFLREAVRAAGRCGVHLGRDPRLVPAPALILFPRLPDTLCCGLAGILTLRRSGKIRPAEGGLNALFTLAAGEGLTELLAGKIAPEGYLGGTPAREAMAGELLRLKEEDAFRRLFFDAAEAGRLAGLSGKIHAFLAKEERLLEENAGRFSTADLESVNQGLLAIRDLVWGLERDILDNIEKIVRLAGAQSVGDVAPEALLKYRELNSLLNCLDRLEVRGRDSAGIQISFIPADNGAVGEVVSGLAKAGLDGELSRRTAMGDPVSGSICLCPAPQQGGPGGRAIVFTYKTAEIIGELGRNIRELRKQISGDLLFRAFARLPVAFATSFAHTRWASVGSITEENCHPVGNFTLRMGSTPAGREKDYPAYGKGHWTIHCVLNGDIDNYPSLREDLESGGTLIAPEVTTDTKVIPLQIEKHLLAGHDLTEAFRLAVGDFEGSHAIAMVSNAAPGKAFLALRGSGQSLYVGIAPDRYIFSSELYGLVEETPFFLKMDGEKPSDPERPETTGQIFVLDQDSPGGVAGIVGLCYDGTPLPLGGDAVRKAEITTRDIDRGDYPHFFLKEITEAAHSVRKTLRGRYHIESDGDAERVVFNLGEDTVPARVRESLRGGKIRRIITIGQGTAAVAASAVADALERCLSGSGIRVEAKVATELSGFCLEDDLSDTLVIPITQSGTTTDTNRAVALASQRGAGVIAIVNRRQSDITSKADGVFYTSDGRDIEMAVASTKAFYSQIVAGNLLALYFAEVLGTVPAERLTAQVRRLEQAPEMMRRVLARKEEIRRSVERLAKQKRYWAVVGSGPNKAAADEIRIKLSELCYKTVSSDVVENKKHIDLSAEPLILVCAAGSPEAVTADIVKDVAIFKAHKSAVVVFADEDERRFDPIADAVIPIPRAPMPLPVILNTMAGHLWGYYAACSTDADALFLREFKNRLNLVMVEQAKSGLTLYECIADGRLRSLVNDFTERFQERRSAGGFSLAGVGTMSDLILLLKYAAGKLPLDDFRRDFPDGQETVSPIDLLDVTLGHAVDELSRPIDAIRHQAKTVTVGTSRKETPLQGLIFDLFRGLGFSARALLSTGVFAISRIQKAVAAVNGHTLYAINRLDGEGKPGDDSTIAIVGRGGISVGMPSRAEKSGLLMGTKRGIVASGRVHVGQGKSDGAPLVIVPLLDEGDRIRHLLLVHVAFNEALSVRERKEILGERLNDIRNLIQEYNLPWEENRLREIPLGLLLGEPVEVIAGHIRDRFRSSALLQESS